MISRSLISNGSSIYPTLRQGHGGERRLPMLFRLRKETPASALGQNHRSSAPTSRTPQSWRPWASAVQILGYKRLVRVRPGAR